MYHTDIILWNFSSFQQTFSHCIYKLCISKFAQQKLFPLKKVENETIFYDFLIVLKQNLFPVWAETASQIQLCASHLEPTSSALLPFFFLFLIKFYQETMKITRFLIARKRFSNISLQIMFTKLIKQTIYVATFSMKTDKKYQKKKKLQRKILDINLIVLIEGK
jgi:hypothetical protein